MTSLLWGNICDDYEYKPRHPYEPDWKKYIKEGTKPKDFPISRIHIRKTGGSAVVNFLTSLGFRDPWSRAVRPSMADTVAALPPSLPGGHAGYWQLMEHEKMRQIVKNGLFYTIVRNPFDWLVSTYFYFPALSERWRKFEYFARAWIKGEETMPDLYCKNSTLYYRELWGNSKFQNIYTPIFESDLPGARCRIPVIIKYERLEEGVNKLLEQFNIPYTGIPRFNTTITKHFDYKHYYHNINEKRDPGAVQEIKEGLLKKHAAEFEMFGYDFDGPTDDSIFIDPKTLILKF